MRKHDDLFSGTAKYYARYRSGYSPRLPEVLQELCGLDGSGYLLDLGTGTGVLAFCLADLFHQVVAVDQDAEMLQEAARIARSKGVTNVQFTQSQAEDLPPRSKSFRLITIGSAFHWMDRRHVMDWTYRALEVAGVLAIVGTVRDEQVIAAKSAPPVPRSLIRDVVGRHLGPSRRAGSGFFQKPEERYEDLLDLSQFGHHCTVVLPGAPVTRTIDDVIGFLYSTSFASRRLFGDRIDKFDNELRRELLAVSPSGKFSANSDCTSILYARRLAL